MLSTLERLEQTEIKPTRKPKRIPSYSLGNLDAVDSNRVKLQPKDYSLGEDKIDRALLVPAEDDEKNMTNWNFDFPAITDIEKSRLMWWMLEDLNLMMEFSISETTLCEFINQMRTGYMRYKNPFHNYNHALTGKLSFLTQ